MSLIRIIYKALCYANVIIKYTISTCIFKIKLKLNGHCCPKKIS